MPFTPSQETEKAITDLSVQVRNKLRAMSPGERDAFAYALEAAGELNKVTLNALEENTLKEFSDNELELKVHQRLNNEGALAVEHVLACLAASVMFAELEHLQNIFTADTYDSQQEPAAV